jgi:steroid delta-isomerase-like uncharacterized protein
MAAIKTTDNTALHVAVEAEELWTNGNVDVLDEQYTDDFVYHGPNGTDLDMDGYRAHVQEFRAAFPDSQVETHERPLDGDTSTIRFTYSGTWKGEFMGMEPTGATFTIDGISMARVEDGKIAEIWRNTDNLGMMAQLGLVDLPA